jgi:hypothetical protein
LSSGALLQWQQQQQQQQHREVRESPEALGDPTSTYRSTLKQKCFRFRLMFGTN